MLCPKLPHYPKLLHRGSITSKCEGEANSSIHFHPSQRYELLNFQTSNGWCFKHEMCAVILRYSAWAWRAVPLVLLGTSTWSTYSHPMLVQEPAAVTTRSFWSTKITEMFIKGYTCISSATESRWRWFFRFLAILQSQVGFLCSFFLYYF